MSRRKQPRIRPPEEHKTIEDAEINVANAVDAPVAASAGAVEAASSADAESSALDYESRRQQQIQRNQALLTQLTGVEGISTSLTREQAALAAEARAKVALQAKEARAQARAQRAERMAMLPRRDMPARRARADVDYREDAIALRAASASSSSAAAATASSTSQTAADGDSDSSSDDSTPRVNAALSDFVVPDRVGLGRVSASGTPSSKLVATLPLSVLGRHLGQVIPLLYHSPKASAMSFLVAGWPSEANKASHRAPPTFNKMSGIQKMANHVAIFINVDPLPPALAAASAAAASSSSSSSSSSKSSPTFAVYGNQWVDGGRRITWFAQPTQRVHTPVIGEILAAARAKQANMDGTAAREQEQYAQAVLQDSGAAAAAAAATAEAAASPTSAPSRRGSKRKVEAVVKLESDATNDTAAAAAVSSEAASSASSIASPALFDPPSLLLFLRHPGGPYLYAGCLAYHSHDTTRMPMKFVFTLAEYDTLKGCDDFNKLLPNGGRETKQEQSTTGAANKK